MLALLRLVRASLAPSLLGDVVAGAALAGVFSWSAVGGAVLASLLLFVGGMALNARVDLAEDSITRPARPLPSGAMKPGWASLIAAAGLSLAPLWSWFFFVQQPLLCAAWTAGMATAIVAYHTPLRRHSLLGPALLGAIRASNVLWGAIAVAGSPIAADLAFSGAAGRLIPAASLYGVYVFGASLVAHQEDRMASPRLVRVGLLLCCLSIPLALGVLWPEARSTREIRCFGVALLIALFLVRPLLSRFRGSEALAQQPGGVGALAGQLLGRMAWFTACLAWAAGSLAAGGAALLSLLAVRVLVRWIPPS